MHSRLFTHLRPGLLALLAMLIVAALPASIARGAIAITNANSDAAMVCVEDSANTFHFVTTDGYISIPDGNTVYMWGYALDANDDGQPDGFQHPGPNLCVTEGSTVTITLRNTLPNDDVSIIFPGQTDVQVTGGISAPNSLAQAAGAGGGTVTYSFIANQPGTFLYESGTDLQKQVQMGLFGSLVVRPLAGPNLMYDASTQFNPNDEYMMLLSEIDPDLHFAVEEGQPFDFTAYHPRYWLINGRAFPDTVAPNNADWLPTQPYGALLHIFPTTTSPVSQPAAMRFLNVGALQHPIHPHGDHVRIVGRDGRALANQFEKFDVNVGPGQTWDALYDWSNLDDWSPSNPLPPDALNLDALNTWLNPRSQNLMFKDPNYYSGSPYLGFQGDKDLANAATYNECGEFYHIWHSHALNEASNYEAGFGGMITLERIDPPAPNTCTTAP